MIRKKDHDRKRESILKRLGMKVIRFKNEKIMNDLDNVIKKISFEFMHGSSFANSRTEAKFK